MRSPHRRIPVLGRPWTLLYALSLTAFGGEVGGREFEDPAEGASEEAATGHYGPEPEAPRAPIQGALKRSQERIRAIEGVVGMGAGRTAVGDDAVVIYVSDRSIRAKLPKEIEGHPVEVVVVPGGFDALAAF